MAPAGRLSNSPTPKCLKTRERHSLETRGAGNPVRPGPSLRHTPETKVRRPQVYSLLVGQHFRRDTFPLLDYAHDAFFGEAFATEGVEEPHARHRRAGLAK